MRITTELQYSQYAADLQQVEQRLNTAQQQETTGLAITKASDNPAGAVQILNIQGLQSQLAQYQSNLSTANTSLGLTSNALTTVTNLLNSAQQIALQAANATTDPETMQNLSSQVQQLQQELLQTANQQGSNGEYLFAGQKTSTVPFTVSNGALTYNGDGNPINVPVGPNTSVTTNVPGSPLFAQAYNALQALQTDLQSGNAANISNNDVAAIQSSAAGFSSVQGHVGAISQQVQSMTNDNTRRQQDLTTQLSGIQDVNTAQATTNYAQALNAYQAALQVIGNASNLSLSNFLSSTNA